MILDGGTRVVMRGEAGQPWVVLYIIKPCFSIIILINLQHFCLYLTYNSKSLSWCY